MKKSLLFTALLAVALAACTPRSPTGGQPEQRKPAEQQK